jgi:hypothetical protein
MRHLMISVAVAGAIGGAVLAAPPAKAQNYPWCASYGNGHGGRNCGFVSRGQCLAAVSGNGGTCDRNLFGAGNWHAQGGQDRRHQGW